MTRNSPFGNTLRIAVLLVLVAGLSLFSTRQPVEAASSISIRSTSKGTNGAGSTSLVLSTPTGTQSGDVLIAQIVINSTSSVVTPPTGWTLILTTKSTSSVEEATFYKAATSSEPGNYTWTFAASQPATGAIASLVGADATNPVDASAGRYNGSTETVRFTQITTNST